MTCKWTDDSRRFVLEYFDVIHNSPSLIYHYALPFSPSKSWLRRYYGSELLQEVKVVKGLQAEWGTCSRTVTLDCIPEALVCWRGLVAVALDSNDIIILDLSTGTTTSVLSGHTACVRSLCFSSDGTLLVSGSHDKTAKLWDIQTGGVAKTFCGHSGWIRSISISPDCTIIASGSTDETIRLWDTQTGECYCVISGHTNCVISISFSPTNSKLLTSGSYDGTIQQWDTNGHKVGPAFEGEGFTFSWDGTWLVSWKRGVAVIWSSGSGVVFTKLYSPNKDFRYCCFSPDAKLIAGAINYTIYVWNITSSDPHLVETFIGHTQPITSLVFSFSLISSSCDRSIKFWQVGTSSMGQLSTNPTLIPPTPASIHSVSLQIKEGIAISSDSAGVVRTWDITTGLCKASFQTLPYNFTQRDAQLVDGRLISVWHVPGKIHIWDVEKESLLQTVNAPGKYWRIRMSGDGTKIFLQGDQFIQAWSVWTGEVLGEVKFEGELLLDPPVVDGSKIWVHFNNSQTKGWDFGVPGPTPTPLSNTSPDMPHLDFVRSTGLENTFVRIWDTVTGKDLLQLPGRHAKFTTIQLYGCYLVAGYYSGELLILDFHQLIPQ